MPGKRCNTLYPCYHGKCMDGDLSLLTPGLKYKAVQIKIYNFETLSILMQLCIRTPKINMTAFKRAIFSIATFDDVMYSSVCVAFFQMVTWPSTSCINKITTTTLLCMLSHSFFLRVCRMRVHWLMQKRYCERIVMLCSF